MRSKLEKYQTLYEAGLTNRDTEYLGSISDAFVRKKIVAYCTSKQCCKYHVNEPRRRNAVKYKPKVPKEPDPGSDFCPDCQELLFFK